MAKQTQETVGRQKLLRWMQAGPVRERGQSAIGRALAITQAAVRQWVVGTSRPELRHRLALEVLTGIPAADWDLPEERKALRQTLRRLGRAAPPS